MIRLYMGRPLPARRSRTAVRFFSLYACYGNCGVVRFWSGGGLLLFAMGDTLQMDVCGEFDPQELAAFVRMMGFGRLYCTQAVARQMRWQVQQPVIELVQNRRCSVPVLRTELKLKEIYDVLAGSGGALAMPPADHFCVDFSHRMRHGGARYAGNRQGLAITDAETPDFACIGGVAVLPEYRGMGHGSRLVQGLCAELQAEQKTVLTSTTEPLLPFYRENGFVEYQRCCYCKL